MTHRHAIRCRGNHERFSCQYPFELLNRWNAGRKGSSCGGSLRPGRRRRRRRRQPGHYPRCEGQVGKALSVVCPAFAAVFRDLDTGHGGSFLSLWLFLARVRAKHCTWLAARWVDTLDTLGRGKSKIRELPLLALCDCTHFFFKYY
jgi:hypothetical protein